MKFTVRNPGNPEPSLELEGLVDTGAHLTQVPQTLVDQIGVTAFGSQRVQYADGTVVTKPVASAEVLGAFTLEGLHLGIDAVRKTLIPLIVPQV